MKYLQICLLLLAVLVLINPPKVEAGKGVRRLLKKAVILGYLIAKKPKAVPLPVPILLWIPWFMDKVVAVAKPYPVPSTVPLPGETKYVQLPPSDYHGSYSEESPVKATFYGQDKTTITKETEEKSTKTQARASSTLDNNDDEDYED